MNPYAAPNSQSAFTSAELQQRTIQARFVFDGDYLVETLARFRSQHTFRRIWVWVRLPIGLLFAILGGAALGLQLSFWTPWFFAALGLITLSTHRIDNFISRRRIKRSPHYLEELNITMSHEGYHVHSRLQDIRLGWAAFSHAVPFPDGVLLFQGRQMCRWLPFRALLHEGDAAALYPFLQHALDAARQPQPTAN
jgi:hypothetical protein